MVRKWRLHLHFPLLGTSQENWKAVRIHRGYLFQTSSQFWMLSSAIRLGHLLNISWLEIKYTCTSRKSILWINSSISSFKCWASSNTKLSVGIDEMSQDACCSQSAKKWFGIHLFVVVQLLGHGQLFLTPRTAVFQAPLSLTVLELAQTHVHWVSDAIQPSIVPFSSYLLCFPASGSFPVGQFFTSDGQSIGASASASVFPMNIQGWFPLRLTGLILQSKGLSRVFSNTTVQKHHQFFGAQRFYGPTHIRTWTTGKTIALTMVHL